MRANRLLRQLQQGIKSSLPCTSPETPFDEPVLRPCRPRGCSPHHPVSLTGPCTMRPGKGNLLVWHPGLFSQHPLVGGTPEVVFFPSELGGCSAPQSIAKDLISPLVTKPQHSSQVAWALFGERSPGIGALGHMPHPHLQVFRAQVVLQYFGVLVQCVCVCVCGGDDSATESNSWDGSEWELSSCVYVCVPGPKSKEHSRSGT